jgi:hypothetical protein
MQSNLWNQTTKNIAIGIGLTIPISIYLTPFYLEATISGVFHPTGVGQFGTGSGTIQIFTYLGAIVSVLGVIWAIWKSNGMRPTIIPVAILAAYLGNVGITMWYEILYYIFGGFSPLQWFKNPFMVDIVGYGWTSIDLSIVLLDLLLVLPVVAFAKKQNWLKVVLCFAAVIVFFVAWIQVGYGYPIFPTMDWWFNAGSRIGTDLVLLMLVWPVAK